MYTYIYNFLYPSSIDLYLGWFHFLASMNNVVKKMCTYLCGRTESPLTIPNSSIDWS